jgi:hypothetical protein
MSGRRQYAPFPEVPVQSDTLVVAVWLLSFGTFVSLLLTALVAMSQEGIPVPAEAAMEPGEAVRRAA